jgi:hypothetical protein
LVIVPLEDLKREGHILKLDLNTFKNEKIFRFTQRFPLEIYSLLIDGHSLFIVYKNSLIIDVFNLSDNTLAETIDVKRVIKELSHYASEQLSLYDSRIHNDTILILLCDTELNSSLQKLIVLKRNTFQLLHTIDIDSSVDISDYNLEYLVKGKIFLKSFDKVIVYDCNTGKLLKEIVLSDE